MRSTTAQNIVKKVRQEYLSNNEYIFGLKSDSELLVEGIKQYLIQANVVPSYEIRKVRAYVVSHSIYLYASTVNDVDRVLFALVHVNDYDTLDFKIYNKIICGGKTVKDLQQAYKEAKQQSHDICMQCVNQLKDAMDIYTLIRDKLNAKEAAKVIRDLSNNATLFEHAYIYTYKKSAEENNTQEDEI